MRDPKTWSEREYFASVAERPLMFGLRSLSDLESFLTGYDQHALRHGGPGVDGWRDWLVARRGKDCNHGWTGQVRHLALPEGWTSWDIAPEQEARVSKLLFELLDEFLAEREAAG
ncbi:hypothetical protein ACFORH_26320 [Amycolatopsis roodepoortensis]|uniref:Uncharacterized protein n=1 Tax=Amycolatopsis roodepoortensis TaxID=700274 RepID=A0ABR9LKM6_9PSEU|nr:hypothetical protein [Amycolatopsis roodepoortensis]MBE1580840.1 hypothetical protein [Amycolatopsis roodepoortensis]